MCLMGPQMSCGTFLSLRVDHLLFHDRSFHEQNFCALCVGGVHAGADPVATAAF